MANKIAPRILRRGLELFALISLLGFGAMLLYGNNLQQFLHAMVSLKWGWVVVGVLLASHDWWGGGLRAWVMARRVYPKAPVKGCIVAGGMATWASYLTPAQTGAGPMLIYTMNRYGVPLPEAMIATLMTFVATVLDGYSYEQAAEMLAVPVGTISSRIHQARQELKATMTRLFGGHDHD